MQNRFKGLSMWLAVLLAAYVMYALISGMFLQSSRMIYSDFVYAIEHKQVTNMVISGNSVTATVLLDNDKTVKCKVQIPSLETLREDVGDEIKTQMAAGTLTQEAYQTKISWSAVSNLILIILLVVMFVMMFARRGGGAPNFTKSRARVGYEGKAVKFSDVAGAVEEKSELMELVEFLKSPKKFMELGARIPKGVLLVGSPGTGKTLLAKAVAGEAGVPFFSISGSDFVELYVGVGAGRVRDLFEQAKRNNPCIIFIDEIDAVGRQRGTGMGGGHDEREQTLNQLLVEMDGFGKNEGVIVIAATNRPDILDPALLRPGRFDRQVVVDLPDMNGREAILKVHSDGRPLSKEVDLASIARETSGYSGAELENLMNEASIFAARRGHKAITNQDLEDANLKVMMGTEKRSRKLTEKEKRLTAYHEAGHAIISQLIEDTQRIQRVSIIPRGRAGGFTMSVPKEDKTYISKNEMLKDITVLMGGRVAEQLKMDDISTGASNDIERATSVARKMVAKYGMSEVIGPVSYDEGNEVFIGRDFGHAKNYSEQTAAVIDEEVKKILAERYAEAERLLRIYDTQLEAVTDCLMEKETINGEEFADCFEKAKGGETNEGN